MKALRYSLVLFCLISTFILGCSEKVQKPLPLFEALDQSRTGLTFSNNLRYTPEFNLFKYMYFYNGSGIGAGDFNNDGRIDLFFGSNQGQNTLFINEGGMRFRDVTKQAAIPNDGGWTTGISVVDINNDDLLDIYVCRVGQYETLRGKNQLLVNLGFGADSIPRFVDKAAEYGLDFSGFSTQAAFFDYDNDSDLDMFLLNHSVHQRNNFRPRSAFTGTYDSLSGDRMCRNDGSRFSDVTRQAGIHSTSISYGLGIAVSDINLDGFPDLYIGNDFHENDYLYINQKNGTLIDASEEQLMHTSQFSMGVDVADANNDAHPEIISVDMLPSDPTILKRSLGGDTYDLFYEKIRMGYHYQFSRNNLQYNRGNGLFSEVGLYSGVAATDWSWAPLWMDFDNDGLKDLFISNGIPKRMNDIDYVNFVTSSEVQQKINSNGIEDISLIKKFPEIRIPNKFYRNEGAFSFTDMATSIENNAPTFSNGAIYADLDNDGDLDIVVSNIDEPALLYENKTANNDDFFTLILKGPTANKNAVGARALLFSGTEIRTYEQYPVRGFLSSTQAPLHIGVKNTKIDSLLLVWPDGTYERISNANERRQTIAYRLGLPAFDFSILQKTKNETYPVQDITTQTGLAFLHRENRFVEFDREPLMPHMISTETPSLAVADINRDGLEDVFIGSARNQKAAIYLQKAGGKFMQSAQPVLEADSSYEDTDACWADVNKDGAIDLLVASGGNEFFGRDEHNTPRLYLNDGKGSFNRITKPFGELFMTASKIIASDINGDGYVDLFIGGRAVPWGYGEVPRSYLFLNNHDNTFRDVTDGYAKELSQIGLVTDAHWLDMDKDGDDDLVVSLEWGSIVAFINHKGNFTKKLLTDKRGWWNFLLPVDVDGDGDMDFIAGNAGLNNRLQASTERPLRLYYADFDNNGRKEQVLTYYVGDKEIPFSTKAELEKQMPGLKKKFLYAEDLAKAPLDKIFEEERLEKASVLKADYLASAVLINNGNMQFETMALPWKAQLGFLKAAVGVNANGDKLPDVLLAGNFYENNIELGRYDADFGTLLINKGSGNFVCSDLNGQAIKGQVRKMKPVNINQKTAIVVARNNDSTLVLRFEK